MSEADAYKAVRGPEWTKLYDALRGHKLQYTADEDGNAYPLVDALTPPGRTINEGEMEIVALADEIMFVLGKDPVVVEAVATEGAL